MNLFDIIGPIMIGPSSSHTAGAARIGLIARRLLNEEPAQAIISLHGSFSKTYTGHGTDRALVGGLLNMEVDDEGLRESLTTAKKQGLEIIFEHINLKEAHPNTVIIKAIGKTGKKVTVLGSSIGGGNIVIKQLNGMEVSFNGDEHTLIVQHQDEKGAIADVSALIAANDINIATMKVFRKSAGKKAIMVLEMDSPISTALIKEIEGLPQVYSAIFLEKRSIS